VRSGVYSWISHAAVRICSVYLKEVNRKPVVYTEFLRPRALRRSGTFHFLCVFNTTVMTQQQTAFF